MKRLYNIQQQRIPAMKMLLPILLVLLFSIATHPVIMQTVAMQTIATQLEGLVKKAHQELQFYATRRYYLDWQTMETDSFHIRYTAADKDMVAWLAVTAEYAADEVARFLPHDKAKKPWLVLAPDQPTIQNAFGWGEGTGALGVYQSDTIVILSPRAWEWEDEDMRMLVFAIQNPLVHEYTHYALDRRAGAKYPQWFSEGLSTFLEYKIQGYEWIDKGSSLQRTAYSYDELSAMFSELPNQARAYRQSLSMVSYLYDLKGMEGLNALISLLGEKTAFGPALQQVYGLDEDAFFGDWKLWYPQDQRWFTEKKQ